MTMPGIPGQVPENVYTALGRRVAQLQRQLDQLSAASGRLTAGLHLGQLAGSGDTNTARWPATASTSWTAVWSALWELQNPALTWNAQIYAPAGVVAQFRVKWGNTVLGTSAQLTGGTAGTFGQFLGTAVPLPRSRGSELLLAAEARVLSGSGAAALNWLQLKGDQTS